MSLTLAQDAKKMVLHRRIIMLKKVGNRKTTWKSYISQYLHFNSLFNVGYITIIKKNISKNRGSNQVAIRYNIN